MIAASLVATVVIVFVFNQTHQAAELIASVASWPVAAVLIVLALRGALRYAIRTLANRMSGAKAGPAEFTFGQMPDRIQQFDVTSNDFRSVLRERLARSQAILDEALTEQLADQRQPEPPA